MARKIVRVYISSEVKRLFEKTCKTLGTHESEVLRYTFLEYTSPVGPISESSRKNLRC
jgi:hypothetical protein